MTRGGRLIDPAGSSSSNTNPHGREADGGSASAAPPPSAAGPLLSPRGPSNALPRPGGVVARSPSVGLGSRGAPATPVSSATPPPRPASSAAPVQGHAGMLKIIGAASASLKVPVPVAASVGAVTGVGAPRPAVHIQGVARNAVINPPSLDDVEATNNAGSDAIPSAGAMQSWRADNLRRTGAMLSGIAARAASCTPGHRRWTSESQRWLDLALRPSAPGSTSSFPPADFPCKSTCHGDGQRTGLA